MTKKAFLKHLHCCGFIAHSNEGWFEKTIDDITVVVGIIPTYDNSPYISVNHWHENDDVETEKEYSSFSGALLAIKRLINH